VNANEYRYYRYNVINPDSISDIRFFLTIMAGKCQMMGSSSIRYPKNPVSSADPSINLAIKDFLRYTK
jgi:hypothetical protein